MVSICKFVKHLVFEKLSIVGGTIVFLILVDISLSTPLANAEHNSCSRTSIAQLLSVYFVHEAVRYGGGLTSESSATARIGERMHLLPGRLKMLGIEFSNPIYLIRCYPNLEEGEVDTNRWSSFYGFGTDRTSIEVLEVSGIDDLARRSLYSFEVVGDDLWMMSDGWLYVLKRSATAGLSD